jgi:hypothetical protein
MYVAIRDIFETLVRISDENTRFTLEFYDPNATEGYKFKELKIVSFSANPINNTVEVQLERG